MFQEERKKAGVIFSQQSVYVELKQKKSLVKIQKNSMLSEDVQEDMLVILQQKRD